MDLRITGVMFGILHALEMSARSSRLEAENLFLSVIS